MHSFVTARDLMYNSCMVTRGTHWLQKHLGFVSIVCLLIWITYTSVRPDLYLIGWDNYSSYLGGIESVFRTIFSTWRSYRGIGVPGDSESVDIFRQLLIVLFTPMMSEPLRDQAYIMVCLWLGVVAIYAVSARIARRIQGNEHNDVIVDIAAAAAAGAYMVNLHTVSTFYFPIVTYITRFAALPLLIWITDRVLYDKNIGIASRVAIIAVMCFAAGSMITATIFFTTMILLFGMVVLSGRWRRGILIVGLFVGLNAFWLVPFGNYAIDKSDDLRLVPIFIDTNEAQLNQNSEAYSLWKQILLYPNFFLTRYTEISSNRSLPLYPSTNMIDTSAGQMIVGLIPLCAIIGMAWMVYQAKKYYRLLWIPAIYGLFIILSSQEHSILGFIPALLNRIPYFQVVFRFGDTKFHPYAAVTMALAVGIVLVLISEAGKRYRFVRLYIPVALMICSLGIPLASVFRPMVTGNMLPQYLFTAIPPAYREVAAYIRSSPDRGLLMHLPYDPKLYWRSHTWGYFGSAFFQYMVPVPYIDKTFEPASLETTDMLREMTDILRDVNQTTGKGLEQRAEAFYSMLVRRGVSWVMFDESVTPEVRIRNMRYWGTYNTTDSVTMLMALEQKGSIERVLDIPIDLSSITRAYQQQLSQKPQKPLGTPRLILYRVKDAKPQVSFETTSTLVDASLTRTPSFPVSGLVQQSERALQRYVYPLLYRNAGVSKSENGVSMRIPVDIQSASNVTVSLASDAQRVIEARLMRKAADVRLSLYAITPTSGGRKVEQFIGDMTVPFVGMDGASDASSYISNWHVLPFAAYSDMRVALNDVVLPVPPLDDGKEYVVGSVLIKTQDINISIYRKKNQLRMDPRLFRVTDVPNCYGDKMDGYSYSLDQYDTDSVFFSSTNGSTCVMYSMTKIPNQYAEVAFSYDATASGVLRDSPSRTNIQSAGIADGLSLLEKPNQVSVCLVGESSDHCLNTHRMIRLAHRDAIIVPTDGEVGTPMSIQFALVPVGLQSQHIRLSGAISFFEKTQSRTISLPPLQTTYTQQIEQGHLAVTLPYVFSRSAYFHGVKDGWYVSNRPCETMGGYRTTLELPTSGLLSVVSGCYNEISEPVVFDSASARLWAVSYAVFSGKQPTVMLRDPFGWYIDEYMSLYQGYPSILGMYALQAPQQWYRPYSASSVFSLIRHQVPVWSHVVVPAIPELTDTREKSYVLHQDSQNTGIVGVYDMVTMDIPESWRTLALEIGGNATVTYAPFSVRSWNAILPSVTRIDVDTHENQGTGLLVYRSAYDAHRLAFPSIWYALVGYNGITPDRCDGVFSCYTLPSTSDTWYLVYMPERLAMIGWIISICIAASFVCMRCIRSRWSKI